MISKVYNTTYIDINWEEGKDPWDTEKRDCEKVWFC